MAIFVDNATQRSDLAYVRDVMREPLLDRDEEMRLALAWHDHRDEKALHLLIRAYSRLVVSAAVRFRHYGLPMSDLIQEGNLGLMQASERFEPHREVRFSTYAKWWVRSSIQDYVLRNWSIVRTGSTSAQKQLFFNLRRLRSQLASVAMDNMSQEDRETIATTLNVSIDDVEAMENRLSGHDLSLSNPMSENGNEDWVDSLVDTGPTPETLALNNFDTSVRRHWIESAMHNLNRRERQIIISRHLSEFPLTLEALGQLMNVSKERIRQLEARALRKMRHHLVKNIHDVKEIL